MFETVIDCDADGTPSCVSGNISRLVTGEIVDWVPVPFSVSVDEPDPALWAMATLPLMPVPAAVGRKSITSVQPSPGASEVALPQVLVTVFRLYSLRENVKPLRFKLAVALPGLVIVTVCESAGPLARAVKVCGFGVAVKPGVGT